MLAKRALATLALTAAAAVVATTVHGASGGTRGATPSCQLANGIKHVIFVVFDNTHFRSDKNTVNSDLQQMPNLLNFMEGNGTVLSNDHTVLISHTADGILSNLTGLYPDRSGMTVGNSYGFFESNGVVGFQSSFKYWTDPVDAVNNPLPNMITTGKKNTPAPWVPFTRAGCDVGGVGTANIELENTATNASGDMTKVFGVNSPEWNEAAATPTLAQTDFVGIAIHCGVASSSHCSGNANARDDLLPDEPGGYTGFKALYGTKYVDPAITGGAPCVNDTSGVKITDPQGNCGFPGFDGMLAANTLGYVEQMQENGVPVTYSYISDAHDCHVPNTTTDAYVSNANGPGEACYVAQLKAYDAAFGAFFQNLAAHGIDKSNTLFEFTADEGDHFAGGTGTQQTDGSFLFSHNNCTVLTACPANQIGEVNANLQLLLNEPTFSVHSDDAPTIYIQGNPDRTSPITRKFEADVAKLSLPDPYIANGQTVPVTYFLSDAVGERALHMINADPSRTPSFTLWGNADFFFNASPFVPSCGANPCVSPGFAWNHGDIQSEIGNNWVGLVGPGISHNKVDSKTWLDHTNVRPTILALTGLKDDYVADGPVVTEVLDPNVVPAPLADPKAQAVALRALYEKLNAPFGRFCNDVLITSTKALEGADTTYNQFEDSLVELTLRRDVVAGKIKTALARAAFDGKTIPAGQAATWLKVGAKVLNDADALRVDALKS